MKITDVTSRTPDLIHQLLEVWESSVRATHLFLSDDEIKSIKGYVPQALNGIAHLVIAENDSGRERKAERWKCCSSRRRNAAKA